MLGETYLYYTCVYTQSINTRENNSFFGSRHHPALAPFRFFSSLSGIQTTSWGSQKGWSTPRFHPHWLSGCLQRCVLRGKVCCQCPQLRSIWSAPKARRMDCLEKQRGLTLCWISLKSGRKVTLFSRTVTASGAKITHCLIPKISQAL